VVNACAPTDYAALTRDLLVQEVTRHQQVVEHVLQRFPVLPVKFGTTVEDEGAAASILRLGYDDFRCALADLKGKVQVELVATWELAPVLEEVAGEGPIAALKSGIGDDSSPPASAIGCGWGDDQALFDRRREEYEASAVLRIAPYSLNLRRNPIFHDSLVMNLALLVDNGRQEELDRALESMDRELGGRLRFRRVGPLPPYSFSTVEVRPLVQAEVERARELLSIGMSASASDVKRAYYRLARQLHPDAQADGGNGDSETRFAEIEKASKLLTTYCRARAESGRDRSIPIDEQQCSFEPDAVCETVLITVGPAGGDAL
jgi:hypothetical protein